MYTDLISFIPLDNKFGLVHTLWNRFFNLSSDFLKFHHEVDKVKKILSKNAYPQTFIDKCIQKFLNMFIQRLQVPTVPKKELIIILPYLGNMSQIVKTKLTKTMNKHMKFCKLRVIFQSNNKLRNYFRFKDSVSETLRSNLIYKFLCGSFTASYIGKTYRHLKVRVSEHRVFPQERVNQIKVPYLPLLGITCLFVAIKYCMKILSFLVMSLTNIY